MLCLQPSEHAMCRWVCMRFVIMRCDKSSQIPETRNFKFEVRNLVDLTDLIACIFINMHRVQRIVCITLQLLLLCTYNFYYCCVSVLLACNRFLLAVAVLLAVPPYYRSARYQYYCCARPVHSLLRQSYCRIRLPYSPNLINEYRSSGRNTRTSRSAFST